MLLGPKDWLTNLSFTVTSSTAVAQSSDIVSSVTSSVKTEPQDWRQLVEGKDALEKWQHVKAKEVAQDIKSERKRVKLKEEHKPTTLWIEESGLSPEKAYRLDRKGDRSNWQYGGLYRLDIANYKRFFRDLCLGISDVDWGDNGSESDKTRKKRKRRGNIEGRYCASEAVAVEADVTVKRFRLADISSEQQDSTLETKVVGLAKFQVDDYIPLPADHVQESAATQPSLVLLSSGQPAAISSTNEVTEGQALSIAERNILQTKYFSETLRDNPTDVQMWLTFANFQATEGVWQTEGEVFTTHTKKDKVMAVAERKIAVLEKALMKNPRSTDLLREYLTTCALVWDGQKVAERWKEVVFKHPNSCQLWVGYLQFAQSRFSAFTVRSIQSLYSKCFSTLVNIVDGTMKSHSPEEGTEGSVLDLFYTQCCFLQQAGYAERAVACFQAQIEFNWFCPAELESTPASGQLAFLETFWDSQFKYLGHQDPQHWNQWFSKQKENNMSATSIKSKNWSLTEYSDCAKGLALSGLPTAQAWVVTERHREDTDFLPWHPDISKGETEDDCTDPDRMVVFDDVSSSLFKFRSDELKYKLLIRFIEFLSGQQLQTNIPSLPPVLINTDSLQLTSTCVYHSVLFGRAIQDIPGFAQHIRGGCTQSKSIKLVSFVRSALFQILEFVPEHLYTDFVLKIVNFELGVLALPRQFSPQQLTKQQKTGLKTLKRNLKSILKAPNNRNNLTLWAMYSLIAGNTGEAHQVLCTALEQATAKGLPSDAFARMELALVFRSYVEMELTDFFLTSNTQSKERSLNSLVVYAEDIAFHSQNVLSAVSSTRVVKAEKLCYERMTSLLTRCAAANDSVLVDTAIEVSNCCALFKYLTRGVHECLATFRTAIEQLKIADCQKSSIGRLYMAAVGILWCHSMAVPSPRHMLRELIQEALDFFPDDIQMFALYSELESRLHVVGRLRRSMDLVMKQSTSPLTWLVSILTEWNNAKKRMAYASSSYQLPITGFAHRIRSLFDRAADQPHVQHCVLLWRLLMLFEVYCALLL